MATVKANTLNLFLHPDHLQLSSHTFSKKSYLCAMAKFKPALINPNIKISPKQLKSLDYYLTGLYDGNRFLLSECITLLESQQSDKRSKGEEILDAILAIGSQNSIRIGITGTPGVGKSSFIDVLGAQLIELGHKVACLAIDPSSKSTKGSILGDKTRMERLANHPSAYIRPTPSGTILGGTASHTKEAIVLCEAAGYDRILIETVGVGQSEVAVSEITDVNILLLQPGAGDDIQGIKKGIVESADIFVINKADGDQLTLARQTRISYSNALHLSHHKIPQWVSPVLLVSSIQNTGIEKVIQSLDAYISLLKSADLFAAKRNEQEVAWFEDQFIALLIKKISSHSAIANLRDELKQKLTTKNTTVAAALKLLSQQIDTITTSKI